MIKLPKVRMNRREKKALLIVLAILLFSFFGFFAGIVADSYFFSQIRDYLEKFDILLPAPAIERVIEKETVKEYTPQTTQEEAIINAVKIASPAVVSIIITKDLPIFEEYYISPFSGDPFFEQFFKDIKIPQYRQKGTEKKEIGGGTGFIVSQDGIILTNKHVVLDEEADYTVFTTEGRKFTAKVLARDPFQDLAILKIEKEQIVDSQGSLKTKPFPVVELGDSSNLKLGQTVIAIGNALGEFRNTISVGVISGLGRTITASGGGFVETIEDVIQTDAAINKGNSGGPLLNLKGEVIGVNTATVLGAQNIGFAIPINKAKRDIEQVLKFGKITYPFLGIYYTMITDELQRKYELPVNYGAWVGRGADGSKTEQAVFPNSAAAKAGLQQDDIILEFDGQKLTLDNSLAKVIQKYYPGDEVSLRVLRGEKELDIKAVLGERSE